MNELKIERIWAMPNSETFSIPPIRDLLAKELISGIWLDPFARNSDLTNLMVRVITNDLNLDFKTDYHMDAVEFLKAFDDRYADGILFDPPYSPRQIKEMYQGIGLENYKTKMNFWSDIKNQIARVCKNGGKVISFGWSSMGMGKSREFELNRILLVPHGGNKNDTICTVETKQEDLD